MASPQPDTLPDARPHILRLTARDVEDLTVISACLQDAVTRGSEIGFEPRKHRFAAVFNRFRWEDEFGALSAQRPGRRVCTALHFDSVVGVQSRGVRRGSSELLQLLMIEASTKGHRTEILLEFAGGPSIRLSADRVSGYLTDLTAPWHARRKPDHRVGNRSAG